MTATTAAERVAADATLPLPVLGPFGDEITIVHIEIGPDGTAEAHRRAHRDGEPDAYEIGRRRINRQFQRAEWQVSRELTVAEYEACRTTGALPAPVEWSAKNVRLPYVQLFEAAYTAAGGAA